MYKNTKALVFFSVFSFIFLFGLFSIPLHAQEPSSSEDTLAAQAKETVEEVNSFELFWPMVAGKTSQDSLYFLKTFKEKVRGLLIFGTPQKADYAVFLATKRLLEAEKLFLDGKPEQAVSALDSANSQLDKAEAQIARAKQDKDRLGSVAGNVNSRLNNISKFTAWLSTKYPDQKEKLENMSTRSSTMASSF